mmetsp:Transcript_131688/g.357572  ORF Transcript_131688/g.357572 Transcript_131688/m.357572 type:complete len:248 (-) Transcript_131688:790-1533(-)
MPPVSLSGQLRPPSDSRFISRVRYFLPAPQMHVPQGPQSCHEQSTAQGEVWHASCSLPAPVHGAPPNWLSTRFVRFRARVAPPQVAVQLPQLLQSVHSQGTGHGSSLQALSSRPRPSHCLPSCAACTLTFRVRLAVPLPHGLEHLSQPPHSSQAQSTGHGTSLQASRCVSFPLQLLPAYFCSVMTRRVRSLLPPAQVREQALQPPQPPHMQSTGQPKELQGLISVALPLQLSPPYLASTDTDRVRDC